MTQTRVSFYNRREEGSENSALWTSNQKGPSACPCNLFEWIFRQAVFGLAGGRNGSKKECEEKQLANKPAAVQWQTESLSHLLRKSFLDDI